MIRRLLLFSILLFILIKLVPRWGGYSGAEDAISSILRPVFHKDIIQRYSQEYHEDPLLVAALIKSESKFVKKAKSLKGAIGLMQIMPVTAREIAKELKIGKFSPMDLENADINIQFGSYHLSRLRKEFGDDNVTVLSAYNAGIKNTKDWLKLCGKSHLEMKDIEFPETRKFAQDVLSTYRQLKFLRECRNRLKTIVK